MFSQFFSQETPLQRTSRLLAEKSSCTILDLLKISLSDVEFLLYTRESSYSFNPFYCALDMPLYDVSWDVLSATHRNLQREHFDRYLDQYPEAKKLISTAFGKTAELREAAKHLPIRGDNSTKLASCLYWTSQFLKMHKSDVIEGIDQAIVKGKILGEVDGAEMEAALVKLMQANLSSEEQQNAILHNPEYAIIKVYAQALGTIPSEDKPGFSR